MTAFLIGTGAWLVGALVIALVNADYTTEERVAVLLWPVAVPYAWTVRTWRRRRFTCRVCGGYFGSADRLRTHQAKSHRGERVAGHEAA